MSVRGAKFCGHNLCQLWTKGCCKCMDKRPNSESYDKYVDGVGWTTGGGRSDGYCPSCKAVPPSKPLHQSLSPGGYELPPGTRYSDGVGRRLSDPAPSSPYPRRNLPAPPSNFPLSDVATAVPVYGVQNEVDPELAEGIRLSLLEQGYPSDASGVGGGRRGGGGGVGGSGRVSGGGGAKKEEVGDLEDILECCICMGRLHVPVTTPCGHTFCRHCLVQVSSSGTSVFCPMCRTPLRRSHLLDIRPSVTIQQILDAVKDKGGESPHHHPIIFNKTII